MGPPGGGHFERNFSLDADGDGRLVVETEVDAPVGGTLMGYSVQLQSGAPARRHSTRVTVKNLSDSGHDRVIGPFTLIDFEEYEAPLTYRVRRGDRYALRLESDGFDPGETVSGLAAALFKVGG